MIRIFTTMNGVEGTNGQPGVSGGDVRLIKIVDILSNRGAFTISATPMGNKLLKLYRSPAEVHLLKATDRPGIFGNLERVLRSIASLPKGRFELAYSGGEHLYDVMPAFLLKVLRGTPWLALIHWVEEYPWKDKRGGTPALHRYLYWLNRVAAIFLIKQFADHVLAVSESTRQKLVQDRGFDPERVSTVLCGLDLPFALTVRESLEPKRFDAVFMKRLNFGKGVRDLIELWSLVVRQRPKAKLQIIGHGPPEVVEEIRTRIAALGLEENIELAGVVHDPDEKRTRLAQSKIFVLPSHEENWAIVIGEALAAGLPVVAYDLKEIKPLWGERVSWIPLGDVSAFADEVVRLLERAESQPPLDDFLRSLDWKEIAENEYRHMRRLTNN